MVNPGSQFPVKVRCGAVPFPLSPLSLFVRSEAKPNLARAPRRSQSISGAEPARSPFKGGGEADQNGF